MEVWSVRRDNVKFGYNAATGKYENLMAAGIIDAIKGIYEHQYELSEEFQQELKIKVPEILIEREWRRKKMQMRILEEEGKLKNDDDEEAKEMWKRKREYEAECVCVFTFC